MINPKEFIPKESRWQDIFNFLKQKGYDVYSPEMKIGECKKPYIVVKNNGSSKIIGYSTDDDYYSVMCYVPMNCYSKLEPYVSNVKKDMKELYPMIIDRGSQTPSFYDDTVKAHMISIEYTNHKKR